MQLSKRDYEITNNQTTFQFLKMRLAHHLINIILQK